MEDKQIQVVVKSAGVSSTPCPKCGATAAKINLDVVEHLHEQFKFIFTFTFNVDKEEVAEIIYCPSCGGLFPSIQIIG